MPINPGSSSPRVSGVEARISSPEQTKIEKINFSSVAKQNINIDVVSKVSNFIVLSSKKDIYEKEQLFGLGQLDQKLEREIQEIKSDTTGFLAFFRYLFHSTAKAQKELLVERMSMLRDFIDQVIKAQPQIIEEEEQSNEEELKGKQEVSEVAAAKPASADVKATEATDIPAAPPPPPMPSPKFPFPPPIPFDLDDAAVPPAPPVPPLPLKKMGAPGAPPPPPPLMTASSQGKLLSEEEKYQALEQGKLDKKLKERANPITMFYVMTPPKDEQKLLIEKQKLEKDIKKIKGLLPVDDTWLKEKETELKNVNERLDPELKPINSKDSEFAKKIANYTNDELKFLIGLIYGGKAPAKTHPSHVYYEQNQELLDDIFGEWDQLKESASGKSFLLNEADWKKYLGMNLFGVITTLKKRNLPVAHKDHLEEPSYKIVPFTEKKLMKSASGKGLGASALKSPKPVPVAEEGLDMMEELQKMQVVMAKKMAEKAAKTAAEEAAKKAKAEENPPAA